MRLYFILLTLVLLLAGNVKAQDTHEPWTTAQLMPAKELADKIVHNDTAGILIVSVGPGALVKGSVDIGPAREAGNVTKLKDYLKTIPVNKEVIIYCGCCPFDRCPNIRPAFTTLIEMGFKNARLLDIPKNIKADWLDKNYPTNEQ